MASARAVSTTASLQVVVNAIFVFFVLQWMLRQLLNTTARIQELCRETGDRVLASADLIDRLELPPGIAERSLGDLRLRGKGADLALYALTKTPPRAGRSRPHGGEIAREETPAALS